LERRVEDNAKATDRLIDENAKTIGDRLTAAIDSQQRAITKAETASESRFTSVNEFRNTLADQQRQFLPRPEYDRAHQSLIERVEAIEKATLAQNSVQNTRSLTWGQGWSLLVTIASVLLTVITIGFYVVRSTAREEHQQIQQQQ
jgi:hypothetical protein